MYLIKEIYFTLQGEGFYTGRPAIFVRFSGCNLWTGLERDREKAICYWCDTDFVGTTGPNGGKYSAKQIADIILNLWPNSKTEKPYIVCTGGEPLLQIDELFIKTIKSIGFEIGLETNGTILAPEGFDWICVSPKANSKLKLNKGNELKFIYPQKNLNPKDHEVLDFDHFFIQPLDNKHQNKNIILSKKFIKMNPLWKLSIQTHKVLGIP